jgi:iodotyrosine deiodinase
MKEEHRFIPLVEFHEYPEEEMQARANDFYSEMRRRRTVRHFSERPVSRNIIEVCLRTAGTAPSGANQQPWHFAVVTDPEIKHKIRVAAEAEEVEFYTHRAPQDWLTALEPYGTNENKPYLEIAPCLIAIFVQRYGLHQEGTKIKHYYTHESVGIATGFLIAALHHAGLATLTHTPSPMEFLNEILGRPDNEKPFLLLVVGYPAADALVPEIQKKSLEEIATFFEA